MVVERIARIEVEKFTIGWPPFCSGIYHQPKRPKLISDAGSNITIYIKGC